MKLFTAAIMLEMLLPFCAEVQAAEFPHRSEAGAGALAPFQMQVFCSKYPRECHSAPSSSAKWNLELETLLVAVNIQVNRDIRPRRSSKHSWTINPATGDCNDYVLTKRSRLILAGLPAGALRMAVTSTKGGVPHMILVVKTSIGDVVLDNLTDEIKALRHSGYSIRMISTSDPLGWIRG